MGRGNPRRPTPDEGLDTDEKIAEAGYATGLDVWDQVGKAYEWYIHDSGGPGGNLDDAQLWSLKRAVQAHAERGSAVEKWLDQWAEESIDIERVLADYRAHADAGVPLDQELP